MDSSLERLLKMSDAEIVKRVESDRRRILREKRKIGKEVRLPSTASEDDRKAVAKVMKMRRAQFLPYRDFLTVVLDKMKPVRLRAITHFTGNRDDLEAMGLKVRSNAQDVFTVVGTRKQLNELASQAACRRLRSPRIFYPTVEHASAQAEIADVHNPRPPDNPNGFRGNNMLVGIIDSVLDVTHHGFRDPTINGAHNTRVLYYWAQTTHTQQFIQGNPPGVTPQQFTNAAAQGARPDFNGLDYGRLYDENDINTAFGLANPYGTGNNQICCEPIDNFEHGTHCAGIAAGSGHVTNWNTNPTHVGAAPEADIIYVRLELMIQAAIDLDTTFEDAILDGIDFCIRAAQFLDRPIAISVSQASNWGPHNGSTDFDAARDNLLNSFDDRSIVFAAGNDNDVNGYRSGSVAVNNSIDNFTLTVARTDQNGNPIETPVWLDIWYTGPELDYRIGHGGFNSNWLTAGQDYVGVLSNRNIEAERDIETSGGLRGIRIYVANAWTNEAYTIELRNPNLTQVANYRAWTGLQGWWAALTGPTQDELTLGDTGCGKSILTVGACDKFLPPNPASGEQITAYSGAGPTVDGRIKPEIVAVGGTFANPIISTASDQNNGYVGMIGTSMATPLVAGAVALLFEEYGSLPPV
jgi:subtilisin family serine protease